MAEPLKIRPGRSWQAIHFQQIWQFRDLLFALAARDVKLRYRQTVLGVLWVVLQPLMAAGIFTFVFGMVAGMKTDAANYFVFSYAGLLGWNAFSSTLSKASGSLVQNAGLISKVYFPRLILPFSTILATLIDFAVQLGMMLLLMAIYRVPITPGFALMPVWVLLLLLLAVGCGLAAGALMVSYRDVQYILPVVIQFLVYASPVGYALSAVRPDLQSWILLNPLTGLLEGLRWSLLGVGELSCPAITYSVVAALVMLVFGMFLFKKMERRFADVI